MQSLFAWRKFFRSQFAFFSFRLFFVIFKELKQWQGNVFIFLTKKTRKFFSSFMVFFTLSSSNTRNEWRLKAIKCMHSNFTDLVTRNEASIQGTTNKFLRINKIQFLFWHWTNIKVDVCCCCLCFIRKKIYSLDLAGSCCKLSNIPMAMSKWIW